MKILSIKAEGFKNLIEETEFNLYEHTLVIGENGIGKTTTGELITWGFLGCTLTGNDKFDAMLMNKDSNTMQVTIRFLDDEGIEHELIRRRKSKVDLSLDGISIKQNDITDFIKDKNLFLSIFNTEYFINLDPTPARKLLSRLLPRLSKEEVMAKMDVTFRSFIENDNFINANTYMNELRKEMDEFEKDKEYTLGHIDSNKEQIRELESISNAISIERELEGLKAELNELEDNGNVDIGNVKSEIELLNNSKMELEKMVSECRNKINNAKAYIELDDVSELKNEVAKLEGQLSVVNEQLSDVSELNDTCPVCSQEIEESYRDTLIDNLVEKSNSILELSQELTNAIKEIETLNKDKIEEFIQSVKVEMGEYTNQISELENDIKENKKILQEHEESVLNRKAEIKTRISKLESVTCQKDKVMEKIAKIEKHHSEIDKKIGTIKCKIDACKHYNSKLMELQKEQVSMHLDKTDIILSKVVKSTGENKDCFKITYDGKEYKLLSTSEKIRAGLEIINLIKFYANVDFPVFIDNAESITHYRKPKGQIIEAKVDSKVKNLQVVDKIVYDTLDRETLFAILKDNHEKLTLHNILSTMEPTILF